MKVTTEDNVKSFILIRFNTGYIRFSDNTEATINMITDYDIDLNKQEPSSIWLTSMGCNPKIKNPFKENKRVVYVHVEATAFDPESSKDITVSYDIPCDMEIIRWRIYGDNESDGQMFIALEGTVE